MAIPLPTRSQQIGLLIVLGAVVLLAYFRI
jgi:hypothetical protein